MVPDRIVREIAIDAPVDRVWDVITRAEHIGRWFGDAGAEIDLRPGGRFTCSWSEHGTVNAVVERVDPPRVFAYRWARPVGAEVKPDNSTLVEFTLEPVDAGTRLRLVESGFAKMADGEQQRAGNEEGWTIQLRCLEEHLVA